MIRPKCFFLEVTFFTYLALLSNRKRCGQMGSTPCYSQSKVVFVCQSFRLVAPFFVPGKSTLFGFFYFNTRSGMAL